MGHFERGEMGQVAMHLSQLGSYCQVTGSVVIQELMEPREAAEVVRQLLETNTGAPVSLHEPFPGVYMYVEDPVDVPDNLDGLDE